MKVNVEVILIVLKFAQSPLHVRKWDTLFDSWTHLLNSLIETNWLIVQIELWFVWIIPYKYIYLLGSFVTYAVL